MPQYLSSLRALRGRAIDTILPGYGGVIQRPDRAIEHALLYYDVRVQRIERGLRKLAAMGQPVTACEMWRALFPKADPVRELHQGLLMVIGALDVLDEREACSASRRDDGALVYTHSVTS